MTPLEGSDWCSAVFWPGWVFGELCNYRLPAQRLLSFIQTRKTCQGFFFRQVNTRMTHNSWYVNKKIMFTFRVNVVFFRLSWRMGLLSTLKSLFICHLIIGYVFLVSGLLINLLQVCTLPVGLVSKQLARRINIRLGYCIASREYSLSLLS